MLSIEEARKAGINACIDKLGREFVTQHLDTATAAYGETEDGVFCFVGVDKEYISKVGKDVLMLDSVSEFQYHVSCNVSRVDGTVAFIELVLPKK